MWSQVYDPFGSMVLSTAVAAIPVVVLLGAIGLFEIRAHIARASGAHRGAGRCDPRLWHAAANGGACRGLRRGLRASAHRLDHPQRHLSLSADEREGRVRGPAALDQRDQRRSAPAASVHRLLARRVLRRCGRVRHAGRRHGGHADRPRLLAARRIGPVAHRQYGAGRLRRARHARHRARGRHRARPPRAERHDRAAAAVLLGASCRSG